MKGIIQFSLKRQGPKEGPSWSKAVEALGHSPAEDTVLQDRRKSPRSYDPAMDRAYKALRAVQARAKHKPNPGLDKVVAKRAAKVLIGRSR